eukprot:scaffold113812_cov28-Attheya_sp.AAC.2
MADARTFPMMPHSTWMGPLRAGIFVIGLSDLGPKKKYLPYRLRASGSDKYDASLCPLPQGCTAQRCSWMAQGNTHKRGHTSPRDA